MTTISRYAIYSLLSLMPLSFLHSEATVSFGSVVNLSSTSGVVTGSVSRVATSDSGNSTVIWPEAISAGVTAIQGSVFRGNVWTPLTDINLGQNLLVPWLASDSLGNAIAVWQNNTLTGAVQSKTLNFNATTWSASTTTISTSTNNESPQLVATPSGLFFVGWVNSLSADTRSAFLLNFSSNTWGAPEIVNAAAVSVFQCYWNLTTPFLVNRISSRVRVSKHDPTWALFPDFTSTTSNTGYMSSDGSGNSIIVYTEDPNFLMYSTLPVGDSAWATPSILTTGTTINRPRIAVDPNGNAVATWNQLDGGIRRVFASVYTAGTATWSTPVAISAPGAVITDSTIANGATVAVGVDSQGNALAAWTDTTNASTTIVAEAAFLPFGSSTWQLYPLSSTTTGSRARNIDLALSPNGNFVISWTFATNAGFNPSYVQSLGGNILLVTPPTSISGRKVENRFLFQSEYFDVINWTNSINPDVVAFRIYRNGSLLTQVGNEVFTYTDQRRAENAADTYGVSAVNSDGDESTQIEIVVQ